MKKNQKKLSLEKFNISKLNNLSKIIGGGGGTSPVDTSKNTSLICKSSNDCKGKDITGG